MPAPQGAGFFGDMITASKHCLIALLFLLMSAGVAVAGLKVLDGEHTVVYDIVNPRGVAFIPDYSNESFEQKVLSQDEFSKRVQVTTKMHPLKSRTAFPVPGGLLPSSMAPYLSPEKDRQSGDAAIVRTVQEITRGSRSMLEASNAILSWIADNLTFDTSITVASDAVSAFRTRRAYCVGYSNLAVAMLRAAGIPARVAHGYLPPGYEWGFSKEYWGVKVHDGGYHAYLELFFPDSGWVFSDAEHSHHFVDPFHLILRLDGMDMPGATRGGFLDVDKATFYTIFQERDTTVMVDELPIPREKRLGRRIDDLQHAALVTGKVSDGAGSPVVKGTVVLWKDGKGAPISYSDGRYAVALPEPGTYRIELRGAGFRKSSRQLLAKPGQVYTMNFSLDPGGVIRGRVFDHAGMPLQDGDVFYKEGNVRFGVPVQSDGSYRIEGLAPGEYTLTVFQGTREASRTAMATAGKETVLDFILK
jgi:hypothetical protein